MTASTAIRTFGLNPVNEGAIMPKTSRTTTQKTVDFGVAIDHKSDLDGYTVNFVTITQSHDLAPILAGLPTGRCTCPHWGYVFKGRVIVRYADGEEVYEAGDAFYMPPGHAPEAEAGTELLQFSPSHDLAEVENALAAMMNAH